jgi:hypothetical protein
MLVLLLELGRRSPVPRIATALLKAGLVEFGDAAVTQSACATERCPEPCHPVSA